MERVKLRVLGLSYGISQMGACALILSDGNDTCRLPIIIGMSEVQSIAIQLEHLQTMRPLTHDLMKQLMDKLNVRLEEVYIYRWEAGIYYSRLLFRNEKEELQLEARTSDAVALALRFGCPIYAAQSVVDATSISVHHAEVQDKELTADELGSTVESNQEFTIEELKRLMEEAVQNEDYENASRFRDMLKARDAE